jgi:CHAD domain-containing protein
MAIAIERGSTIFRKTERDLSRLSKGYQPEVVHNFRTTTRRLEVLLEQLAPDSGRNEKKLLKALGKIRKRAGRVRDLDVQLAALRSLKVPLEPRRKTQFTQRLLELRVKQEKKLGKLLKKKDLREIQKRLQRVPRSVDLNSTADPSAIAKKMIASVDRPKGRVDEEVLHSYRTVVKRARYAAEFAPKSEEATRLVAQLKRLQDALGNWHDWLILTQTAEQHLGGINQSPLVAALQNVMRGKFRHAVAELSANTSTATQTTLTITQTPYQPAGEKERTSKAALNAA